MPIEVVGCPIIREPDGLALSSRNRYLSGQDRTRAAVIPSALCRAYDAWERGERRPDVLRALVAEQVEPGVDRVDYVAAVDPESLLRPERSLDRLLIAVAAHLGGTRLIDNLLLGEDRRPIP
jgi:pantoate--beta-alanine ligase